MQHELITTKNQDAKQRDVESSLQPRNSPRVSLRPLHQIQQALGNRAFGQFIQAKLKISQPGDAYEQEADRVADEILRMQDPQMSNLAPPPEQLQRACSTCAGGGSDCSDCANDDEKLLRKEAESGGSAQPQEAHPNFTQQGTLPGHNHSGRRLAEFPNIESSIDQLRGGGRPLAEAERAFFEPRFGHDFRRVRVHIDSGATTTARAIHARAYTAGRDIVFGSGEYAPGTVEGRRLLAHELAHVVQQSGGIERQIQRTVDNVEINCADSQIRFDHDGDTTSYTLDTCNVTDGTYDAGVTLGRNMVDFDLGVTAPGTQFDFHYSIAPGQPTPNTFFAGQRRVNITCTHVSRSGTGLGDIHFNARRLTAQEFQELTGQPIDTIPEGVMVPLQNIIEPTLGSYLGPASVGASRYSPTPWTFIPRDTTGVLWVQGHTSIFANPEGAFSPTIRGYRGNLGYYAGELLPVVGPQFTVRLHEGVPGSFANDAWFPLMPGEQYWVFAPRSSSAAQSFASRLQGTQYGGEYTYSPPRSVPDPILGEIGSTEASVNAELRARGLAPMCTNNCITVPTSEIEGAIGGRPTSPSGVDVMTGRGPEGSVDPYHAGRGRLMTEAMGEGPLPAGVSRLRLTVTPGGSAGMFVIRGAGTIMLVYGIYQTEERIRSAVGTGQLPTVITEEAGSWTGGILGSAFGGAAAGAVFCAPTGPIDAVCVVGGFLGGLVFGIAGSAAGHAVGHFVGETVVNPIVEKVNEVEADWTRGIYNLYGVPYF